MEEMENLHEYCEGLGEIEGTSFITIWVIDIFANLSHLHKGDLLG
jgi:hypothetical protein